MFYNQDDILTLSNILREIESYSVHDLVLIQEKAKEFCLVNSWDAKTREFLNNINIQQNNNYRQTTFGHAPQLDPRPLAKIGLEWRTS